MNFKNIIMASFFSFLFGCKNDGKNPINRWLIQHDPISEKSTGYVQHYKTKKIKFKSVRTGGGLGYDYVQIDTDLNDFEVLNQLYAKDKKNVFYRGIPIENTNPNNFEIIGEVFGKDKKQVFHKNRSLLKIDPKNTVAISNYYLKTSSEIFYVDEYYHSEKNTTVSELKKVTSKNAASFLDISIDENPIAKDDQYVYLKHFQLDISSKDVHILKHGSFILIKNNQELHTVFKYSKKDWDIELPNNLTLTNKGKIGVAHHNEYYHYVISGFENPELLEHHFSVFWIADDTKLYLWDSDIKIISNELNKYSHDKNQPNYLKTNNNTYGYYINSVYTFSNQAKIISRFNVIDNNQVYHKGAIIPNADIETVFFSKKRDVLVDAKNMYLDQSSVSIPPNAYKEIKAGKDPYDYFGYEYKNGYEIQKQYSNGCYVYFKIPGKNINDNHLIIEIENVSDGTIYLPHDFTNQFEIAYRNRNLDRDYTFYKLVDYTSNSNSLLVKKGIRLKPTQKLTITFPKNKKLIDSLVLKSNPSASIASMALGIKIKHVSNKKEGDFWNEDFVLRHSIRWENKNYK